MGRISVVLKVGNARCSTLMRVARKGKQQLYLMDCA